MRAQVCAALWIKVILMSTLRWTAHATSIIQLLNSLLFLCHGRHSSVSFRAINIQTRFQSHAYCRVHELRIISEHLKGQLDPPVGDVTFFCTKGCQLDPPVGDVTFFAPKDVSWILLLVTSRS